MKKLKSLIFLFIVVLCITGCGKDNSKQELKDALLKMKGTQAIAFKASITMGSEEMKIPYNIEMNMNKDGMHMKLSVNFLGYEQAQETYVINKDNESYVYTYDTEEKSWSYLKGGSAESIIDFSFDGSNSEDIDKGIDKLVDSFDEVKKVKSDKDGYDKYEMKISKKTIEKVSKEDVDDEEELKEIENSLKAFPDSLLVSIYLKDKELAIVSLDLSNMEIPTDEMPEGMNMKVFDFTVEILGRNDAVKVELPKEVEESATYMDTDLDLESILGA